MRKYKELFRIKIKHYFVYRLNLILWRFRVVLNLILIYFLWSAIYVNNRNLFGYTQEMMLTYVLIISLLSDVVFSSKIHEISEEIMQGDIINKLLKPISFFSYVLTREVADKAVNISFSLVEISILIILFQPKLVAPHDEVSLLIAMVQLLIGMVISFFVSFCVSMIAFWSAEIWAPRFIYMIMTFMLAGNYFPLDILPKPLYTFLLLTPFPYFIFLPAQTYLKGMNELTGFQLMISILWAITMFFVARFLWRKGMREYSFYGK